MSAPKTIGMREMDVESDRPLPGRPYGALPGCPFCQSLPASALEPGARFRFLTGSQAGRMGTVLSPLPPPYPQGEGRAQMDQDPPHWQQRLLSFDLAERLPIPEIPTWAPPIELREAAELDEVVVRFCEASFVAGEWTISRPWFYEIIRHIWRKRLPLSASELWKVLGAHGVPDRFERTLMELFQNGRDLLVHAVGRKPIRKKRVTPLRT